MLPIAAERIARRVDCSIGTRAAKMAETTDMTDSWRAESWGWKDARTAERSEKKDGCWAELMVARAAKRVAGSAG